MSQSALPMLGARRDQMFPTMTPADIDRLQRFGESKFYETGERIVRAGHVAPGLIVILSGKVEVTHGCGPEQRETIVTHLPGQFVGELAQIFRPPVPGGRRRPSAGSSSRRSVGRTPRSIGAGGRAWRADYAGVDPAPRGFVGKRREWRAPRDWLPPSTRLGRLGGHCARLPRLRRTGRRLLAH